MRRESGQPGAHRKSEGASAASIELVSLNETAGADASIPKAGSSKKKLPLVVLTSSERKWEKDEALLQPVGVGRGQDGRPMADIRAPPLSRPETHGMRACKRSMD